MKTNQIAYRPAALVETERMNKETLKHFVSVNPGAIDLSEQYAKQLHQLGYEYYFLIHKIEQYFADKNVHNSPGDDFEIVDSYKNFMRGFTGKDRKRVSEAMRNNKFGKVTLYMYIKGRYLYKEIPFISFYIGGEVNRRVQNLKNITEDQKMPVEIQVKINKRIYGGIYRVLNTDDKKIKRGYYKTIPMLSSGLKAFLCRLKKEPSPYRATLNKIRFSASFIALAEKIINVYNLGAEKRSKMFFDLGYNEVIRTFFPGYVQNKTKDLKERLRAVFYVIIIYIQSHGYPVDRAVFTNKDKIRIFTIKTP